MLCDRFAVKKEHLFWESPVNPLCETRRSFFLDGGVEKMDGNYCGRKGTWIFGKKALRFILFELGWPNQPRRLKIEQSIPLHEELTAELAEQHAAELSRKAALINI